MKDLEIIENLIKIRDTAGNNAKEDILKDLNDNDFKQVLKYLYDTQYVFGLSTKKIDKATSVELKQNCETILDVFKYLETNNTGTDFDIFVVQSFIKKFSVPVQDVLKEMFCKKLKTGITEKTLAKIYPDMFVKYEVMAGEQYEKRFEKMDSEKPNVIVTQKFDGCRCTVRVENGNVKLFARSGKLFTGLKDLEKELATLPNGAYDGELLKLVDGSIMDLSNYPENSVSHKLYCPKNAEELYSDTVSIVNSKDEDKKDIALFVFDMIPLENFDKKEKFTETTSIRKAKLELAINMGQYKYVKNTPILYEGKFDANLIDSILKVAVTLEQEGVMLNYADAGYEFKRTSNLIKVKQVYTADVKVIGFEEGTGKNKGKLGALIIKTPQGVELKVGSGIDDKDREYVWQNQAGYIGCIFEIAFTTPSTSKDSDLYNLRFPRFKRWRPDKTEENWEEFDKVISQLSKE